MERRVGRQTKKELQARMHGNEASEETAQTIIEIEDAIEALQRARCLLMQQRNDGPN